MNKHKQIYLNIIKHNKKQAQKCTSEVRWSTWIPQNRWLFLQLWKRANSKRFATRNEQMSALSFC